MSMWAEQNDFDAEAEPLVEPAPLTVSAYAARIQLAVKRAGSALVEGEVRDAPHLTGGGMLFFSLTDGDACISCKVFGRDRLRLAHQPKQGDLVKVRVDRPDFYPKNGQLTLIVSQLELAGEGELLKRRELLMSKLAGEGLTDPGRRPQPPPFPRAVGVVSGNGSKALKDVVQALRDRYPPVHIVICTTLVQGVAAPAQVTDALARLQQHPLVDVIVIARGGGSVQDLVAFDDEGLCRAIFACETPVVTAIGHTENDPVCNHVATAAYTPSRSAELVVPDAAQLRREIELATGALALVPGWLEARRDSVTAFSRDVDLAAELNRHAEAAAELGEELREETDARLASRASGLAAAGTALRLVPHRLPDPAAILALGSKVDRRAHELFSSYRAELATCGRALADAASALTDRRRRVAEAGRHIATGTRRQLSLHERNYSRAFARLVTQARTGADRALSTLSAEVEAAAERVTTGTRRQLGLHERNYGRALSRLVGQARASIAGRLSRRTTDVALASDPLSRRSQRRLSHARTSLGHVVSVIAAHDFRRRGWLLAEDETGETVSSVAQVKKGQRLRLRFRDGRVRARAEQIEEDNERSREER
jgi:exodeoxyribonuclease VII large subunit